MTVDDLWVLDRSSEMQEDGRVAHLVELTDDRVASIRELAQQDDVNPFTLPDWLLDTTTLCTRGRFSKERFANTDMELVHITDRDGTLDADGTLPADAPSDICSYCWTKAQDKIEQTDAVIAPTDNQPAQSLSETPTRDELQDVAGTRYRWKPKGYARDVWWDILVPDPAPATDLQRAISSALGLHDEFHAWEFADHTRPRMASVEVVMPDAASRDDQSAADTTGADLLSEFTLGVGDRVYYLYDLATPVITYGIVKERIDDCGTYLADHTDTDPDQRGTVFVLRGKGKRPSRY